MGNCQRTSDVQILTMNKLRNGPIQQLQITTIVWNKDYQGLFDYESKQITKNTVVMKSSGIMMKINNQFKTLHHPQKIVLKENSDKILFKFIRRVDAYCIEPVSVQNGNYVYQKNVWMIVKTAPQKLYSLREGDIIKLGRQRIRVKQKILKDNKNDQNHQQKGQINAKKILYQTLTKIKVPQTVQKQIDKQITKQNFEQQQLKTQLKESKEIIDQPIPSTSYLCRICLDPGTNSNPLITPCKCAGSMKYIHLICLQMWLGKRLNPIMKPHSVTINWKPLLCQLCTAHFLYKIYIDNKRYYTVEIPRPPKPYLVLEVIHRDKTKKKVYHLISFAQKKKLTLGRKQDTDVKISDDISVSRNHSTIKYDEETKQFIIEDLQSKFGTLILVKKRLVVRQNTRHLSIQVGPNIFQFEVRRGFQNQFNQGIPEQQEEQVNDQEQEDDQDGLQEQQVEQQQKQEDNNVREPEGQIIPPTQALININQNNLNLNQVHPQPNQNIRKVEQNRPTSIITKKQVRKQQSQRQIKKQQLKEVIKESPTKK